MIPLVAGLGGDMPFKYWTYGAAATEVELDVLTGSHRVLRADIVMDLGQPLNPALDIGQIEGAYVQARSLNPCSCIGPAILKFCSRWPTWCWSCRFDA